MQVQFTHTCKEIGNLHKKTIVISIIMLSAVYLLGSVTCCHLVASLPCSVTLTAVDGAWYEEFRESS